MAYLWQVSGQNSTSRRWILLWTDFGLAILSLLRQAWSISHLYGRVSSCVRTFLTLKYWFLTSFCSFFSTVQVGAFSEWIYESLVFHFHDLESRDYLPPYVCKCRISDNWRTFGRAAVVCEITLQRCCISVWILSFADSSFWRCEYFTCRCFSTQSFQYLVSFIAQWYVHI